MFCRMLFNVTKNYNTLYPNLMKRRHLYSCLTEINSFSYALKNMQYSSDCTLKCWNCQSICKSGLVCSKCKVLQEPPENLTYFNIMEIPENYNVKVAEIHNKYRELQKLLHPDKYSNKSEKEKELSENLSSLVNKAYSTLIHPLKRGLYMLQLNNISISEETESKNSDFLIEIMEINEKVDDAGKDEKKILQLVQENEVKLSNLSKDVADAFQVNDLKKAEAIIIKMKYYNSINFRLKKLKHDLGIVQ